MQHTFDQIEDLKRQYTDKYVLVDTSRPELRRFQGETGRVKTVNMSGRALVQFDMANNIGWYDIALDYLHVVDGPQARPTEAEGGHARAAAPAKVKPESPAAAAGGKKVPEPTAGKKSTADVLAAARAAKGAAGAPAAKAPAAKAPAAGKPAGAKPAAGKLSTAEILAAARAAKEHPPEEEPAPVAEASAEEAEVEELEAEAAQAELAAPVARPAKAAGGSGAVPTTTAEKIAWCREHDAKG